MEYHADEYKVICGELLVLNLVLVVWPILVDYQRDLVYSIVNKKRRVGGGWGVYRKIF